MYKAFFLIPILAIFYSCASTDTDTDSHPPDIPTTRAAKSQKGLDFRLSDTLLIPIDSVTSVNQYYGKVIIVDDTAYYSFFNPNTYQIQMYSLLKPKKSKKIQFQETGIHSIYEPRDFYWHNADSIFFITTGYPAFLILADVSGNVAYRKKIELELSKTPYWVSLDNFYDFYYYQPRRSVWFWSYPEGKYSYEDLQYWKQAKGIEFGIADDSVKSVGGFPGSPLISEDRIFESFEYINSYRTNSEIIHYFHPFDIIYGYDLETLQPSRAVMIESKFQGSPTPPTMKLGQEKPTADYLFDFQIRQAYCAKMVSDGRFSFRIEKLENNKEMPPGKKINFFDKPFSVIALDEDFNIIDELAFDGGLFEYYMAFAHRNKLYVSLNNPINPIANKNQMQFAVFKIHSN